MIRSLRAASGLALAALIGAFAPGAAMAGPLACDPDSVKLLTAGGARLFHVEIADEPGEQARGLMYRPQLAEDAGMLFVFDRPRPAAFWMRNTMVPLDMIFLDARGQVDSVAERRDTYSERVSQSQGPVRAVLEINAGLAHALGIGPGTQAVHPVFTEAPEGFRCPAE